MDMDDDDAFLYGDEEEVTQQPTTTAPAKDVKPDTSLSASMAASLAAYGIDPTTAVAAENPEDGGVEEEDPEDEDEDSDSDEDDVKVVFNTGAQRLDLRKPQSQPSNIIGVGKWAHTSTGTAAPTVATPNAAPATPRVVAPTANQTTEYTPTSRPGTTPTPALTSIVQAPLVNPAIPPSGDEGTAPNIALPSSSLPPVTSHSSFKIDPENPSGIIPSTGNSTYDIDVAQFEGSGQPWRRPGSDIQDWFNFGFDEVTYPKFLRYRQEMEIGRAALMNMPMGGMNPEIAQMLHLPNPMMAMNMGNMNQMNQMAQLNQMGQMAQMGQMGNMPFTPQQMQAMQQQMGMGGMGMDGMMMQQQQQQFQQQQQQMQGQQGLGQMQGQPMHHRSASQRMSATPAPGQTAVEGGEEVKQEEGADSAATVPEPAPQAQRGQIPLRGMPAGRGTAMRGRGGAIPSGPRAGVALPVNIPKGPKAGRFKDKDKVENATSDLNYGDEESSYPASNTNTGGGAASRDNSPTKSDRRSRSRRQRERSYDDGYDSRDSYSYRSDRSASPGRDRERDRDRSRRSSRRNRDKDEDDYDSRERERDRGDKKKDKRKREESGGSGNVLGPGGWATDEEEEARPRRKKSYDSEEEDRYARRSKRR